MAPKAGALLSHCMSQEVNVLANPESPFGNNMRTESRRLNDVGVHCSVAWLSDNIFFSLFAYDCVIECASAAARGKPSEEFCSFQSQYIGLIQFS